MDYKINKKNLIFKTSNLNSTIGVLTIEPNKGSIDPLSSLKITIELQPVLLGAFEIEFELQVCHNTTYYLIKHYDHIFVMDESENYYLRYNYI